MSIHVLAVSGLTPNGPVGVLAVGLLGAVALIVSLVGKRALRVSEVVAFLAIGLVLGPTLLEVIDSETVAALQPLVGVALGAMVFVIGQRLQLDALRPLRKTLTPTAVLGNLATFAVVLLALLAVGLELSVAYLLAAMAPSTAPVTVRALVSERRAAGPFTDNLLSATAVNNVVAALLFGLGAPFVFAGLAVDSPGQAAATALVQVVGYSVAIGVLGGIVLRVLDRRLDGTERFLAVWATLLVVVGATQWTKTSVVITTLLAGAVLANAPRDTTGSFDAVRLLEAPIFLVFFIVTGAEVRPGEFLAAGLAGAVYVAARTAGRVGGTYLGVLTLRDDRYRSWRWRAGLAQLPYAGMAVGLASFTVEQAAAVGAADVGTRVAAVILGAVLIFELVTPVLVDRALQGVGEAGGLVTPEQEETSRVLRTGTPVAHVLLPVPDAGTARRLGGRAVELAATSGSLLTLLQFASSRDSPDEALDAALDTITAVAREAGVPVTRVVRDLDAATAAIAEESRQGVVDLVVVGDDPPNGGPPPHQPWTLAELSAAVQAPARIVTVPQEQLDGPQEQLEGGSHDVAGVPSTP